MNLSFLEFAEEILRNANQPLTYQEIYSKGVETGLIERLATQGKTPWQTLGARLYVDTKKNSDESRFVPVGQNPIRFFLRSRISELTSEMLTHLEKAEQKDSSQVRAGFHERDLHPLLAYFLFSNPTFNRGRSIYSKTVFHEKSKHDSINEWTHPDMVGFYMPIEEWNEKLLALSKAIERTNVKLYSFELKKEVNRRNYRECFFQAVSNSSWAHEGYLVTANLEQRDDLLSELERLSIAFGIGLIRLVLEDIDSSEVILHAKEKEALDWEMMNKLSSQNRDFEKFLDDIRKDYEVSTIHESEYDKVIEEATAYGKRLTDKVTRP